MASSLPTLTKTWTSPGQFSVNNAVFDQGSVQATLRLLLRSIKNAMKAFPSNGWTVTGSSDAVTAGMDATDRWSADSKLVGAAEGVNHSWIVLKQASINTNYCVLINLQSSNLGAVDFWVSPNAAFTGGSITNRPTSTQEFQITSATEWISYTTPFKYHAIQSDDGQCTRIIVNGASQVKSLWVFDRPQSPHASWTDPCVQYVYGTSDDTGAATYDKLHYNKPTNETSSRPRVKFPFGVSEAHWTGETFRDYPAGVLQNFPEDLSSAWAIRPIAIHTELQGTRGRVGRLFDLYWGTRGVSMGDTYPASGTKLWAHFGDIIVPWDGLSVPQVS